MGEIKLTQGYVALVDDEDFVLISKYSWHVQKEGRNIYARTNIPALKKYRGVLMHILLMGKKPGLELDHINHNGIDNRRKNLRHVTRQQNQHNRRHHLHTSSKYKGVSFYKGKGIWVAQINKDNIRFYLGTFPTQKDAALAYDKKSQELHGVFGNRNLR